jgi:hypothetical protein
LVQAMTLGEVGSLDDVRDVVRSSFETTVYEPVLVNEWRDARARFAALSAGAHLEIGA